MVKNSTITRKELIEQTALCSKYCNRFFIVASLVVFATLLIGIPIEAYVKNYSQTSQQLFFCSICVFIAATLAFSIWQPRRFCRKCGVQYPHCNSLWNIKNTKAVIATGKCVKCGVQLFDSNNGENYTSPS